MVRSFGSVAAVAAAALALMIGFLAFSAHQNNDRATPPGSQAAGPVVAHGRTMGVASGSAEVVASRTSSTVPGSSGGQEGAAPVFVAPGGAGGAGGSQLATPTVAAPTCNPGLLQSLIGAIGSLLGGGGASC